MCAADFGQSLIATRRTRTSVDVYQSVKEGVIADVGGKRDHPGQICPANCPAKPAPRAVRVPSSGCKGF